MSAARTEEAEQVSRPVALRLMLLNAFELECDGAPVVLPMSACRVIAFVAIQRRPVQRSFVAGSLWLDTAEERAQANLRSALWRIRRCGRQLVESHGQLLSLRSDVVVDLRQVESLARSLHGLEPGTLDIDPALLAGDLLPDWYDEWILFEREQFRQVRLAALDALCDGLTRAGRHRDALAVGLAAVAAEPLRESAHRAVIRVHLAEGNLAEAIRQYRLCRRLLAEQLDIEPSERMRELMRSLDGLETVQ